MSLAREVLKEAKLDVETPKSVMKAIMAVDKALSSLDKEVNKIDSGSKKQKLSDKVKAVIRANNDLMNTTR